MKKTLLFILVFVVMTMTIGCSCKTSLLNEAGPLQSTYDIQYEDDTAVSIELMLLSPKLSSKANAIQNDLDEAVNDVARKLPKSVILSRQDQLRLELDKSFKEVSNEEAHLVVMGVYEIDSQQANVK